LTGTHLGAAAEAGRRSKAITLANPSTVKKRPRIFNPPGFSLDYLLDCFTPGPTMFAVAALVTTAFGAATTELWRPDLLRSVHLLVLLDSS
jgi:hypothetical protein